MAVFERSSAGPRLQSIAAHILPASVSADSVAADLVIRDATIIDGTGSPSVRGDLAVRGGKIVSVGGRFAGKGAKELNADSKVLAPGFIDIHTHFDPQLCWDGRADPSIQHGVTTVVTGNCSLSLAPVANRRQADRIVGMFGRIEDIKKATFDAAVPFERWEHFGEWLEFIKPNLGINVAALIGHSVVRMYVMGEEAAQSRAATPDEISVMCQIVEDAMRAGAVGVSSSHVDMDENGNPVPSRFADMQEKIALAKAMKRSGRGVWQIVPLLAGDGQLESIKEIGVISSEAGVVASFQPVLTQPDDPERKKILDLLDSLSAKGARVYGQCTPRDFNMNMRLNETSMLLMGLPGWGKITMMQDVDERLRIYSDPVQRKDLVKKMTKAGKFGMAGLLGMLKVGDVQHEDNKKYQGRTLFEIMQEEKKEIGDVILDIGLRDELRSEFRLEGVLNSDKQAVSKIVQHPMIQLGASDAGAHITQFCGTGDTTYFLEQYVKKDKSLPLEFAIQQLTGELAKQWGISDRGTLEVGRAADLVLFDLDKLENGIQEYVNDMPGGMPRYTRHAKGFEAVFVNGEMVLHQGQYTEIKGCGQVV